MTLATIEQGMEWLYQQTVDHPRLGLDAMHQALDYFNNPHLNLPVIHITGTNGKGSTTAFLSELFLAYDQKVVTLTSPHIMSFNERYQVNNQNIDDETLLMLLNKAKEYNDYCLKKNQIPLSTYEIITLLGILFAAHIQPDVFIAEVGIGGLLDTTNVLNAQVAVITTIGLDHGDKLGDTLQEVAYQKAGIIKPSSQVVVGNIQGTPLSVIQQYAISKEAIVYKLDDDFYATPIGQRMQWDYTFKNWYFKNLPCSLLGRHQIDNAGVALTTFIAWMESRQQRIDETAIRHSLATTHWMARMEKINDQPLIYLDGAHNAAGIQTLSDTLANYFPNKQVTLLFAGLDTKNQAEHLHLLAQLNPQSIYLTTLNHPYAMTLEQFEEILKDETIKFKKVHLTKDWQAVIDDYLLNAHPAEDHLLLVTGSLYFVSDVRSYLTKK
ncbi:bifunctional folylpolyglutamate synthase/dihydrofolate synthase [Dolosicoccus paucivorans]|uniref:bifunctional folylpolyglutamate synthase/dihydrofolate synthase n=1 Tax=Dolosicoccus paucivorans TaxID=84521 RepID=UPI00088951D6|nr:folylpolyglutamate synthase/dihydrofolate synthase family protein [Dolosicoccus paucivorans]SDI46020.1 dihydrofolate synthase / folylpolyglutamate synthase [Dolosicoccus paucivorans]